LIKLFLSEELLYFLCEIDKNFLVVKIFKIILDKPLYIVLLYIWCLGIAYARFLRPAQNFNINVEYEFSSCAYRAISQTPPANIAAGKPKPAAPPFY